MRIYCFMHLRHTGKPIGGKGVVEWNQIQCTFYAFRKCYCCSLVFRKYAKQFVLFALWGECEFRIICMANRGRGRQRESEVVRCSGSSCRFDCGLGLFSVAVDHLAYANKTCNPIDKYLSSWQRFKRDIGTLRPRTVAN